VRVLDFGLAKAMDRSEGDGSSQSNAAIAKHDAVGFA